MTKPKRPKTKKLTVPKLKEIYGKKAPDYARRPKARGQILRQMRDEAEATGRAEKLDVTLDDVVALEDQDDLDRSIAERTAKNKNFPALVDAAQKRAEAFNAEERIAELETENARLRAALEEIIRDLDADMDDHALFVRLSERIAIKALATDPYAAMPPELVEALRAYEKRMFSGDVRKLLKPTRKKKRKAKKKP